MSRSRGLLASVIGNPDVKDVALWSQIERVPFSMTSGAAATRTTLQTSIAEARFWIVKNITFHRTAGSAATYQIRLSEDASWTDGVVTSERVTLTATAVGTDTNHNPDQIMQSDANGRLYIGACWDAGADNAASGWVDIEPVLD